jgi:hypothetical protein
LFVDPRREVRYARPGTRPVASRPGRRGLPLAPWHEVTLAVALCTPLSVWKRLLVFVRGRVTICNGPAAAISATCFAAPSVTNVTP